MRRELTCVSSPRSRSPLKHDAGSMAYTNRRVYANIEKTPIRTGRATYTYTQQNTTTIQMPAAKPTAPRRRNRKRKRRQASSSSPSNSSDSSSDESELQKKTPVKEAPLIKPQATRPSPSPSLSSSSSSSSDSEGGDDDDDAPVTHPAITQRTDSEPTPKARDRPRSPSPSPPPTNAPPFLPPEGSSNRAQDEQALRNRFRQFWMASVADAFADDLEQIRQVRVSFTKTHPSRLSQT
jgi:ribosome assembly protein 3